MLPSFTLFGLTLYPYSLCMIGGAALCFVLLFVRTLRRYPDALDENLFALSAFVAAAAVALYEAAFLFVLFFILFFVGKNFELPLYLSLYGIGRFIIEFFRNDDRGALFGSLLSPAQIVSCFLIVAGIALMVWRILLEKDRSKSISSF